MRPDKVRDRLSADAVGYRMACDTSALATKGLNYARNKCGRGSTSVRALLIGELVEIDECKISLVMSAKPGTTRPGDLMNAGAGGVVCRLGGSGAQLADGDDETPPRTMTDGSSATGPEIELASDQPASQPESDKAPRKRSSPRNPAPTRVRLSCPENLKELR